MLIPKLEGDGLAFSGWGQGSGYLHGSQRVQLAIENARTYPSKNAFLSTSKAILWFSSYVYAWIIKAQS